MDPYFKGAKTEQVVVILKAREPHYRGKLQTVIEDLELPTL